jgi:hypothetical protein
MITQKLFGGGGWLHSRNSIVKRGLKLLWALGIFSRALIAILFKGKLTSKKNIKQKLGPIDTR